MPRQIDLSPQNLTVANNPNTQLGMSAGQLQNMQNQLPALIAKATQTAITDLLREIDAVTGLDLVGLQALLNGMNAALQQSWLNFQQLINSVVGGIDKDVLDLINALNSTGGDAATAIANWDTLFLDLGFSVTTASQLATWLGGTNTTAVNGSAWATRLTNDLLITSDVFHLVYNVGLSTDTPTTLGVGGVGAGKRTWYSAWNDLLLLCGVVNSVTAPTDPAPAIGTAITTAQSTATTANTTAGTALTNAGTANTNATTAQTWATRLTNDLLITSDVFHLIYNVGTTLDTPTTLGVGGVGAGKRTWYSAWNDLLALTGVVNSVTPPTDPAPTVGTAVTTAQSTATTASSNVQNVADAVHQTVYGGMATGTPTDVATLVSALTNQPAATVVPPPNPNSSGAVAGGATGTSWTINTTSGTSLSITGSHTPLTADNVVLVPIYFSSSATSVLSSINRTVNYGLQGMSSLGAVVDPHNTQTWVEFFVLFGPVGAQTITANISSVNTLNFLVGSSRSYSGVGSVGTVTSTGAINANPSQTVTSATNDMIVQVFTAVASGITLSSYNKTQRYNSGTFNSTQVFLLGDAAGASSVTFTATASTLISERYVGVAVNLLPSPAIIGSTFRAYNNSTTAVNGSTGTNTFPNSFFNVTDLASPDFTYSTATANTLTVANAGSIKVVVHVLEAAVTTPHYVRPALYHNGSAVRQGPVVVVSSTLANTFTFGFSWSLYCQAGDTLQPGYWLNGAVSSVFVGESTGQFTYWEAATTNRSLL